MTVTNEEQNVAVAFAVVLVAGMSTAVGAAIVCIPGLAKYATNEFLAGSLSFSAGVMMYLSFVDVFPKSVRGFEAAGYKEGVAMGLSSLCFFMGIAIIFVSKAAAKGSLYT